MIAGGVPHPSSWKPGQDPTRGTILSKSLGSSTSSLEKIQAYFPTKNHLKRTLVLPCEDQKLQAKFMKWKDGQVSKNDEENSLIARVLNGDTNNTDRNDFKSQWRFGIASRRAHNNQHFKQDNRSILEKLSDECEREILRQKSRQTIERYVLASLGNQSQRDTRCRQAIENQVDLRTHTPQSNCSDPTSTESVDCNTPMDTKDSVCPGPPLHLSAFDTPDFMWCPKYLDQANKTLLDMLGIQVQVSTGYEPGMPVGKQSLAINHQLPGQRTYSRTLPPKDVLKVLLLDSCAGDSDIVATVQ